MVREKERGPVTRVKSFYSPINFGLGSAETGVKIFAFQVSQWRESEERELGRRLRNVVLAQSHGPTEIVLTVWYE